MLALERSATEDSAGWMVAENSIQRHGLCALRVFKHARVCVCWKGKHTVMRLAVTMRSRITVRLRIDVAFLSRMSTSAKALCFRLEDLSSITNDKWECRSRTVRSSFHYIAVMNLLLAPCQ